MERYMVASRSKFRETAVEIYKNKLDSIINVDYNKVWVFHHTDLDGYCSGHLCERWLAYNKVDPSIINLIPADYHTDFMKFGIGKNDLVFFVDLSFSSSSVHYLKEIDQITKNIIWIDHHASNIDLYYSDKVLEEISSDWLMCVLGNAKNIYSAAMLVYCSLFNSSPLRAPYYVKLASDWDTWAHKMEESEYFSEAMNGDKNFRLVNEEGLINYESTYIKLWEENSTNQNLLQIEYRSNLHSLLEKGKILIEDKKTKNERYLRSNGFEFDFLGYKMLACNQRSNSMLFGNKINEYDLVCPFVLQERNGKLIYTYSLFTAKDDVNCKDLATIFGGGGHQKAAGFSLNFNIFTSPWRLKLYLLKNKLFKK